MDKSAIKKFAVWARTELIARVSLKGVEYGITEDNIEDANADSVGGKVLTADEKKQRQALIVEIKDKGYKQVMEEVAYTWFNRFSALRFMEVNGYLPSHVRVFTDEENNFKPQIIAEAIHLDLDGINMEKVYELKESEKTEELYKYLLIVQCNALNKILPGIFQKIADYTELLLPDNLLREGSVIQQMIELIPEDDWKDAVQIIGWLYQYYNSEKKDDVFAALKKNVKITKENIPAATQLFTPDWIVRYMVENSLGRLWLEGHPDVKEQFLPTEEEQSAYAAENRNPGDTKWHYYLEEAEQEPEVQAQLAEIRKEYAALTPDQIKCIDPCCGSGHILAYMFDVLMRIYESYGYTTREAVASIVENNLYGLDIDDRAAQLAYFAVMMKARQYDRRFFSRGIQPHVYAIVESNHVDQFALDYFCNGDAKLITAMDTIIRELHDAKEYGSILTVTPQDWSALYDRFAEITEDINMSRETALRELLPLVHVAEALAQKYDVVVTNPPYMGASNMNPKLNDFIKKNYADYKSDFFSAFVVHASQMTKQRGCCGFFTPYVWMFIQSYEKMRNFLYNHATIETLIQFEYSAFEEATVPVCTFVFQNRHIVRKKGCYLRLVDFRGGMEVQRQKTLEALSNHNCGFYYEQSTDNFSKIPGSPVAYWVSKAFIKMFDYPLFYNFTISDGQNKTGNNAKYVRFHWEVNNGTVGIEKKWLHYAKGGGFRKWYGNLIDVVDWSEPTRAFYREDRICRIIPEYLWYRRGITWGLITSSIPSFRVLPESATFDVGGSSVFFDDYTYYNYFLGVLNSKVFLSTVQVSNPTLNFQVKDIRSMPIKIENYEVVENLVNENVHISQNDWDSYEISWDFVRHPLLPGDEEGITTLAGMKINEKKWILALKDGSACFSPVEDFIRQGEKEENNEQGDKYEGVFARVRNDSPRIKEMRCKLGIDLEEIQDGDYVMLRRKSCRSVPVFCMYGFHKEDAEVVEHSDIGNNQVSVRLKFTPSSKMFGEFLNGDSGACGSKETWGLGFSLGHLQNAIEYELDKDGISYRAVKINYDLFDSDEFFIEPTAGYPELNHKSKRFAYQKEVRFILPEVHQDKKYILPYKPLGKGSIGMFKSGGYFMFDVVGNMKGNNLLRDCFEKWKDKCDRRFTQLKANEEELNHIFIDIYGLQDELTPEVEDRDVTVHRIFDTKEDVPESIKGSNYVRTKRDEIVSLISYAVGCMFGRYSLDEPGLAYAGGEWDASKYVSFAADKDNVIPICDDEYFEDDIVGRFVEFVKTVFGEDTLNENLKFIADALGGKGQPKDVIRNYFLNDFYKDHCKIYQKRPIYWLFDSGKKNGFKALIYMHRYQPDTIARIRTDYVHEQQARYRTAIADLEQRIANASTGERVKLKKKLTTLQAQDTEIRTYEEKIHHLADQMISIDLDDGVKKNYAIFQDVLAKIK